MVLVKRLKYLSFFIILSLIGFYVGSRSEILGQGLFFAEVEDRGPASSETKLQELFDIRSFTENKGVISMTSLEEVDYCKLIEGVERYKVTLTAEGVKSGDKSIKISVDGSCIDQGGLVVFESAICDTEKKYKDFIEGFDDGISGAFIKGYDLDKYIPVRKLSFFISELEVWYDKKTSEERMQSSDLAEPLSGQINQVFSCEDSFSN